MEVLAAGRLPCPAGTVTTFYGRRGQSYCAPIPLGQLPKQDVFQPPAFDVLPEQQRVEATQPVVEAYIGDRPVFLSMPDVATSGGRRRTIPLTVPRMRRQYDVYYGRAADRYVRSELTGLGQDLDPSSLAAHQKFTECLADCDSFWARTFGNQDQCVADCADAFTASVSTGPPPGPGPGQPPDVLGPDVRARLQASNDRSRFLLYALPIAAVTAFAAVLLWPPR